MNWFSVTSVFLLVVACADAGWVEMTADKEPTHLKGCLKLDNAQPVVSCRANFVVKKKEDKLTFSIDNSCTFLRFFVGSQEYDVSGSNLKNQSNNRVVSVLEDGTATGILEARNPPVKPLVLDNGHIALKFEQIDCEVRLVNLVPVVSDVVQKGGLSETAKIGIGIGCTSVLIGLIGLVVWKYVTWKKKHLKENQEEKNGRRNSKTGRNRNAQKPVRIAQSL